jgi:predicted TPR repeat methyltransferase
MDAGTVTRLFDGYAGNFDQHLVGKLQYHIPAHISATLRRMHGNDTRKLSVLDIGCGTGLVGAEIRDMAEYLAGVDLSPKMVEQARQRGIYDELREQDVVSYMEQAARRFDAVLSADVFIYIGDLDPVFSAVSRCLTAGGLFVFSEEAHVGSEPYRLRTSGRYAHSLPYLRELSARYGFEKIDVDNVTIRLENDVPIEGYVVTLRRSPA